ncbi:MAG: haloacid dehalogenase-like hydrolase [Clostridia bacterium]|nr:haloacid dehalogenase-like hydrolase [Clostridia bacterium]
MILIFDFDGTLTPFKLPQYKIFKLAGYTDERLKDALKKEALLDNNFYRAFYVCLEKIYKEREIEFSPESIVDGAENVVFNSGVEEFFDHFGKNKKIKKYVVTSGIKSYVEQTKIALNLDGIFGVTFDFEKSKFKSIEKLLTDKDKVDAIKEIQSKNKSNEKIVYFGDGMSDRFAFEYVHSIGGISVLISQSENKNGFGTVIDEVFEPDFSKTSKLFKFVDRILKTEK